MKQKPTLRNLAQLELHLKKNDLPTIKQLENYYYNVIDKLIALYIYEMDATDLIFRKVFSTQLSEAIPKISSKTLEKIILQKLAAAAKHYCDFFYYNELKKEMSVLQYILSKIKTLPNNHREIITLRLQNESPSTIEQKCHIKQGHVRKETEEAINHFQTIIKKETSKAWKVFKAVITSEPVEIIPIYERPTKNFYI